MTGPSSQDATSPDISQGTASQDTWLELVDSEIPVGDVYRWAVRPDCGAVVLFSGTVRDHAEGRTDVVSLDYEAHPEGTVPVFANIAAETRRRYPDAGNIAIIHRIGRVHLGESSVVVAVSSAHRPVAFDAARFAIDALKQSAPIWKKENWIGGSDWGTDARIIVPPDQVTGTPS